MLTADQFVASKALDEAAWFDARRSGLTATTMAKAMTPAGYRDVVAEWGNTEPIPDNPYMAFGRENETWVALWVKDRFGVMPNEWLIRHPNHPTALATPDGISLDHDTIAEVKTSGKDWGTAAKAPIQYQRQVQWQLYVTGASSCVFAWLLRAESEVGVMVPAWLEPKCGVIERDEIMIAKMVETSRKLWEEIGGK
jgi:putative phage-type endonuclease